MGVIYSDALPELIRISTGTRDHGQNAWHPCLEIYFMLQGRATLEIEGTAQPLEENDIIAVNAYTLHRVVGQKGILVRLELNIPGFRNILGNELAERYHLDTTRTADPVTEARQAVFRRHLAQCALVYFKHGDARDMLTKSLAFTIVYLLNYSFGITDLEDASLDRASHVVKAMEYIQKNFKRPIGVPEVAQHCNISSQYLMNIFKQETGYGVASYINRLRLERARHDLEQGHEPVGDIALRYGFPSGRAFSAAFRRRYGVLPTELRQALREKPPENTDAADEPEKETIIRLLEEKTDGYGASLPSQQEACRRICAEPVDTAAAGTRFNGAVAATITVGRAANLLGGFAQQLVADAVHELKITTVLLTNIFDDEILTYTDVGGNAPPVIDFSNIDVVLDFLVSLGLRPMLELSFTPRDLASHDEREYYYEQSNHSMPKSLDKWAWLVRTFTQHVLKRYGAQQARLWLFSVWHYPELPRRSFQIEQDDDLLHLYATAYHAIKQVDPRLKVGSPPSQELSAPVVGQWFAGYISFCKQQACLPDFLKFYLYPLTTGKDGSMLVNEYPDVMKQKLAATLSKAKKAVGKALPVYLTEWNSTFSNSDLPNDTLYKAAYVVKNILENQGRVQSVVYSSLSDRFEGGRTSPELFHGGLGMTTHNGIKKAHYWAYSLIARMGEQVIASGDNYYITRRGGNLLALFYNPVPFSVRMASRPRGHIAYSRFRQAASEPHKKDTVQIAGMDRYAVFKGESVSISVPLLNLGHQRYIVTEKFITKEHGSVYDKWVSLGAVPLEESDAIDYLSKVSLPLIRKKNIEASNNAYELSYELLPHEVVFVELEPVV